MIETNKPFQRKGALSNTEVGRDFEMKAQKHFMSIGLHLEANVPVEIGINGKKLHSFDLGDLKQEVLVECKSHPWTETGNVPSAKLTTWNQAMSFFYAAPQGLRKIFFVLKAYNPKRGETLARYYLRTYPHLIPEDVEIWEYDEQKGSAEKLSWRQLDDTTKTEP